MIIQFLNLLLLVEKNQISDLSKLLNEISGLLNPKLLNAILSLPKLLNEISSLLNPKILIGILSLPKLLNKISSLLKFLNVLDEVRQAYITFVSYQPIPPSEAPTSPQYINKNGRQFLPSWYKLFPNWLENAVYCLPCFSSTSYLGVMEILLQAEDFDRGRRSMKDLNVLLLLMWVRMQNII
ncbi:hypothetical protein PVK06_046712 [Gossypium arboreum]|uniref:Uncharacterized protein n=1 Tax=Gossypium arboreum TaxID=29729 RepID=A0ABR0MBN9_GOSAR|nr:hypothetical protein PVK06_046712 [Gossypium arboreum]